MASALFSLPPEQLSLINSLLRNGDSSIREIGKMTYQAMGGIGHCRSERAWEMLLYRHKESKGHLRIVRQKNMMQDAYAISDLTIRAIEEALSSEDPVPLAILNVVKSTKAAPGPSLMQRLEAEIDAKITKSVEKSPPSSS